MIVHCLKVKLVTFFARKKTTKTRKYPYIYIKNNKCAHHAEEVLTRIKYKVSTTNKQCVTLKLFDYIFNTFDCS